MVEKILVFWLIIMVLVIGYDCFKEGLRKKSLERYEFLRGIIKTEEESSRDIYYIFSSRRDAERNLEYLQSVIDEFGCVSISEYKFVLDRESTYVDSLYGWTDLKDAIIRKGPHGYEVDFPKIIKIRESS